MKKARLRRALQYLPGAVEARRVEKPESAVSRAPFRSVAEPHYMPKPHVCTIFPCQSDRN